jgi:Na+/proline symporter
MLGVFLLGTLSRRAGERGTLFGMAVAVVVNLLLWIQPHTLSLQLGTHTFVLPKIAWTWWVLIGSLITCIIGYVSGWLFPETNPPYEETNET